MKLLGLLALLPLAIRGGQAPAPAPQPGQITGRLGYPSESLPDDLRVVAVPAQASGQTYATSKRQGRNYLLRGPAGRYYVYATTHELPGYQAYYTELVTCGLSAECLSHAKIVVVVKAGATTPHIDPQDWYDNDPAAAPVTSGLKQ